MKKVVTKKNSLAVKKGVKAAVVTGVKTAERNPIDGYRIQLGYKFLVPGKTPSRGDLTRATPANGPIMGPPTPPRLPNGLRWQVVEQISWPTGDFDVEIGLRFVPRGSER